ncbi:hypothetical protein ACPPVO_54675 [Dactylosporangium sp. McL0621]|uniref:hypothetical protein n=1 Tax=Dactylosporangium sp. McL0621 TaxID=3415678 RepID=UPI003CF3397D
MNYVGGDQYNQYGEHSVGRIEHHGGRDPDAAFRDLLRAVQLLRAQVPPADRRLVDEQLQVLAAGPGQDPGTLRRALGAVAGVATVVGQVGAPVIQAVRQVAAALGM